MDASATVVQHLRHARLTPSTRSTYTSGQRAWAQFCTESKYPIILPESMPVYEIASILEMFVGYLLVTRNITRQSTINSYLSAVSALHTDAHIISPTLKARRAGLMREILQGLSHVTEAPIQSPGMTILELAPMVQQAFASKLESACGSAALCTLAATAMLRVHEYIVYQGQHLASAGLADIVMSDHPKQAIVARKSATIWRARQALRTKDVTFSLVDDVETLNVHLRAWKYRLPGTTHTLPIQCTAGEWYRCCHCCVKRFLSLRKQLCLWKRKQEPSWLSQLSDGTFLRERDVTEFMRQAARLHGYKNWRSYTPHGFRRGAATALYQASKDYHLVQEVGRWRSNAGLKSYIKAQASAYHQAWQEASQSEPVTGTGVIGTASVHT